MVLFQAFGHGLQTVPVGKCWHHQEKIELNLKAIQQRASWCGICRDVKSMANSRAFKALSLSLSNKMSSDHEMTNTNVSVLMKYDLLSI